jgi:methyltransferase-like protein
LRRREFRHTLLVRQGVAVDRRITPERMADLYASSDLAPARHTKLNDASQVRFSNASGQSMLCAEPHAKTALGILAQMAPDAIGIKALVDRVNASLGKPPAAGAAESAATLQRVCETLKIAYGAGFVSLKTLPDGYAKSPPERPVASPWARYCATRGDRITTLACKMVTFDKVVFDLLPLFDGTRGQAEIVEHLHILWAKGEIQMQGKSYATVKPDKRLALLNEYYQQLTHGLAKDGMWVK